MTIRALKSMFRPRSIAIIGRGQQDHDPVVLLTRNLINAGFHGPVLPVHPQRRTVSGVLAYPDIARLPETPELAIIAMPLAECAAFIGELGVKGTRAVLLISDETLSREDGDTLSQTLRAAAKQHRMRLLGPDQMGMAVPANGINATLGQTPIHEGYLSVVTQSSTVLRAILNWAHLRNIGFSHLVSLGGRIDVDCSDLLDHLAQDPRTRVILMYLEEIPNPRRFLSAARAAARLKPVVVLKPRVAGLGSSEEAIYDAAFRRAGILRVSTTEQLFNAVITLVDAKRVQKNRVFIVSNSHSMGLLAADMLSSEGGTLAALSETTRAKLTGIVPPGYHPENPLDLGYGASFQEYGEALEVLLTDPGADAVLITHVPISKEFDPAIARAIVARVAQHPRPVVISLAGATPNVPAWQLFQEAGLAIYRTPEEAVWSFARIAEYHRNQELLMATPPSIPEEFTPDAGTARRIIAGTLAAGKHHLDTQAARRVLEAYQIPMVPTWVAANPEEASAVAREFGGSMALKILSPAIQNRSDVGGVALSLEGSPEVYEAASAMQKRVQTLLPGAVIEGFVLQPMLARRDAYEVAIGVRSRHHFKVGPVLYFGHGGTETRVINDIAYALPPLNMHLAWELMSRTRLFSVLRDSPGRAVNLNALALTLLKVAQMVVDLDGLVELDINPLWVSAEGVLALSARILIAENGATAAERLAIHPYPKELERRFELPDGRSLCLRPILPEDEPALQAMVRRMPVADIYRRFFRPLKELSHQLAARLTQLDYDREMALVLTGSGVPGKADILGMVNLNADADLESAEYAIIVDRSLAGLGMGSLLMRRIIAYARQRGIREVFGEVLCDNESMLKINRALGFSIETHSDDPDVLRVSLSLTNTDSADLPGHR